MLVTLGGQLVIGLLLAILVYRVIFTKRAFRAIYYLPVVTSWLAVSFLFRYLFDSSEGGIVNYILLSLRLIPEPIAWLNNEGTV